MRYAIPYEQIFKQAAYGRGVPMWGGKSPKPATAAWPQKFPYSTDLKMAQALLAQTKYKYGFEVPLSYDLGEADWGEPAALLIQESLGKIGIKVTLDKVPGANRRTVALVEKKLPFLLENFGRLAQHLRLLLLLGLHQGQPVQRLQLRRRCGHATGRGDAAHGEIRQVVRRKIKQLIQKAFDDVPRIPLWQPTLESAMAPNLQGYEFWFHRQVDARKYKLLPVLNYMR